MTGARPLTAIQADKITVAGTHQSLHETQGSSVLLGHYALTNNPTKSPARAHSGTRQSQRRDTCSWPKGTVTCNIEVMATRSKDRVRAHRERLRAKGLRPIQIWVPDVTSPDFAREAHRQSQLLATSPTAEDDQLFTDELTDWDHE